MEENHCLIQYSPFDVRNFYSVLATPMPLAQKCLKWSIGIRQYRSSVVDVRRQQFAKNENTQPFSQAKLHRKGTCMTLNKIANTNLICLKMA